MCCDTFFALCPQFHVLLEFVSEILQVRQHVCDAQNFLTFKGAEIKGAIAFSNRFFVGPAPILNFGTAHFSMTLTQSRTKALVKIIILPLVQGLTGNATRRMKSLPECEQQSVKSFNFQSRGALLSILSMSS